MLSYFYSQGDILVLKCFYGTQGVNSVTVVSVHAPQLKHEIIAKLTVLCMYGCRQTHRETYIDNRFDVLCPSNYCGHVIFRGVFVLSKLS